MHPHDALLHDALERRERRWAFLPHSVDRVATVVQYLRSGTHTHREGHAGAFLSSVNWDNLVSSGGEGKLSAADGQACSFPSAGMNLSGALHTLSVTRVAQPT